MLWYAKKEIHERRHIRNDERDLHTCRRFISILHLQSDLPFVV